MGHKAQVFGHRGSRATHPENTIAAFQHAMDAGADGIEFDVTVSRDNVLVVTHDLVHAGVPVRSLEWAHWSATFPRIEQVLQLNGSRQFVFDIEMKSDSAHPQWTPEPTEFAEILIRAIGAADMRGNCIVRSFDSRMLRAARRCDSALRLALLYEDARVNTIAEACELGVQIVSPEKRLIRPELVREAHSAGLQISAWTVNAPDEWDRLTALGVDTIITDDPAALVRHYACFSASGPTTGSTTD